MRDSRGRFLPGSNERLGVRWSPEQKQMLSRAHVKEASERYKGGRKMALMRYNNSEKKKVVQLRYQQTPKWKISYTRYKEKLRSEVRDAYGGKCQCCGETIMAFLTIHHVGGKVNKGEHGVNILWSKVRQLGFPANYELRCFNCNSGALKDGTCPHKLVRIEKDFERTIGGD